MKKYFYILFCLFPLVMHSQKTLTETQKKLAGIEKLLQVKPDSAQVLIRQITNGDYKYHDTIYAMANVYHGYYYLVKNNPDSSIYYYNKALSYASRSASHRARALRMMATPYRKKANYQESLRVLGLAEKEYEALNNNEGLAMVYGEIASNYNLMLRSQDAIPYLTKAIAILEKANNKKALMPVKQSLANTYMNIGNYEFAVELYKDVLKGFKELNLLKNYYLTLINYSECLTSLKKFDEAKQPLLEAIDGLEQFGDTELIGSAYGALGRIENREGNFEQGEIYLEKAFKLLSAKNSPRTVPIATSYLGSLYYFSNTKKALDVISQIDNSAYKTKASLDDLSDYEKVKMYIYKKAKKTDLALESAANTIELKDTLKKVQDKKAVIEMQAAYQYQYQDKKKEKLVKANTQLKKAVEANSYNKWLWIYLPLALLALLAALYFYRQKYHKKKVEDVRLTVDELATEQQLARQLNEELKASIDEKQEELASMELAAESMQENINRLIASLGAKNGTGETAIDGIRKNFDGVNDKDYWEAFRKNFLETHASAEKKIRAKFPHLGNDDIFFFLALRHHLSYKDLAVMLQVLPETIVRKKHRLKKRIGVQIEEEFEHLLQDISS